MSGRPRTPTKVLELRGAFRKHPERRAAREGEPEPAAGVGAPPDVLDAVSLGALYLTDPRRWQEGAA